MQRSYLGEFEELVLLTIAMLNGEGYGVSIAHAIEEHTGRNARLNQVHAALHRLEAKGMTASKMGRPTPERGGRRKRLFKITALGQRTIGEIQEVRSHLWDFIVSLKTQSGRS